jgi:surfeit locus 1 family protein
MAFPFHFRPRALPTVLAIVGVVATAYLGDWQLRRAAYKAELQQRLDFAAQQSPIHLSAQPVRTEDVAFYRVEAEGQFRGDLTILLDNRVHNGVVGYEVVTPLKLQQGTQTLLVNRGWVAAPPTRSETPAIMTPSGTVRLEGIALPPPGKVFQLSSVPEAGQVWQHLSLDRFRERYRIELQPIVLEQRSDTGDGLIRDWPRPDTGIGKHRAYALQWFIMSGAIFLLYTVSNVRKRPKPVGPA